MPRRRVSTAPQTQIQVLQRRIEKLQEELDKLKQPGVTVTHAIDKDYYYNPVQGEVEWDYPHTRAWVWHDQKWHPLMPPAWHIKTWSDWKEVDPDQFRKVSVSRDMDKLWLIDAEAYITTSGSVTVQLTNNTQGHDMLSTPLKVSSGQKVTKNSTPKRVIHPTFSQVNWGDEIWLVPSALSGSVMGLGVKMVFSGKPLLHDLDA